MKFICTTCRHDHENALLIREGNRKADVWVPADWSYAKIFEYLACRLSTYPWYVWDIVEVKTKIDWAHRVEVHAECREVTRPIP